MVKNDELDQLNSFNGVVTCLEAYAHTLELRLNFGEKGFWG